MFQVSSPQMIDIWWELQVIQLSSDFIEIYPSDIISQAMEQRLA